VSSRAATARPRPTRDVDADGTARAPSPRACRRAARGRDGGVLALGGTMYDHRRLRLPMPCTPCISADAIGSRNRRRPEPRRSVPGRPTDEVQRDVEVIGQHIGSNWPKQSEEERQHGGTGPRCAWAGRAARPTGCATRYPVNRRSRGHMRQILKMRPGKITAGRKTSSGIVCPTRRTPTTA